jgi:A/G-specific adenine glycosylase
MAEAFRPGVVRRLLLQYYDAHRRALPWRGADPYGVWVSEVMLQQTRVDAAIPYYRRWMRRFPSIGDLARAELDEVLKAWEGLGYYARARNLHAAARELWQRHGGALPADPAALRRLPGIGPYTAGAIACFAFEQDVGFFDTNIRRVLHRLFFGPEVPQEATTRQLQNLASTIVPPGNGWEWNQALMEFGAIQCTARKPACLTCPLQRHCRAFPEIQTVLTDLARAGFRRKKEAAFEGSSRF